MTIKRPLAEEIVTRDNKRFTEPWLRAIWAAIDRVSGRAPPQIPTVYINPTGAQRGLPSSSEDGQLVLVADETGGPVPAFSYGGAWRRVTDRAVIS